MVRIYYIRLDTLKSVRILSMIKLIAFNKVLKLTVNPGIGPILCPK